jgi:hypothetical protein
MSGNGARALEQGWQRFARAIGEASEILGRSGIPDDPVALAEAYDYWAQVVTFGLRREFHFADRDQPFFHRCGLDTKIGFDNPDNVYQVAKIRPDASYRVTGNRGSAFFLECSVSVGFPGVVAQPRTIAKFDTTELEIAPDGTLEMFVGGPPRARNWFPLEPDATSFLVRQVFYDWDQAEPGFFRIERVGLEGEALPSLRPEVVADRLQRTAEFVEKEVRYWVDYILALRARVVPNSFEKPGLQGRDLPHVNAARAFFCWGLWDLAPDEALIVEIEALDEGYMGFHLNNFWLQSLDYANRITSLNRRQARVDADGRIRYVLAHADPGAPNWLDIEGHPRGAMLFRFALTQSAPQPSAGIVKLADLWQALPHGTPRIGREERALQLARRRTHVQQRFRW